MNREEFKERTSKFLTVDEIARYEVDFEPAYMSCEYIDKDDFCAILKDERVRKMVTSFSKFVLDTRGMEKSSSLSFNEMVRQRDEQKARAEALEKSMMLIQSTCDRVMSLKKGQ